MKKISLVLLFLGWMSLAQAFSPDTPYFNAVLANQDFAEEPWDIAALHAVVRDSALYQLLMTMQITVPSMAKTGEYVLMYNEIHQVNQNLELILAELKKMNIASRPDVSPQNSI